MLRVMVEKFCIEEQQKDMKAYLRLSRAAEVDVTTTDLSSSKCMAYRSKKTHNKTN